MAGKRGKDFEGKQEAGEGQEEAGGEVGGGGDETGEGQEEVGERREEEGEGGDEAGVTRRKRSRGRPVRYPQLVSYRLRQFEQARGGLEVARVQDDGRRRCGRRGPGDRHSMRHLAESSSPATRHHTLNSEN